MEHRTCLGWQEDPMQIFQEIFHYVSVNSADIFQRSPMKMNYQICLSLHAFAFLQNVSRFFMAYIIAVLLLYIYFFPDRLVPRRERTAVSQEQERAAHKSAAAPTASSSKSLLLYLYLIDLASSKVLFSGLELVFSILLSYGLNSKPFF